jgi:hypothetical protein
MCNAQKYHTEMVLLIAVNNSQERHDGDRSGNFIPLVRWMGHPAAVVFQFADERPPGSAPHPATCFIRAEAAQYGVEEFAASDECRSPGRVAGGPPLSRDGGCPVGKTSLPLSSEISRTAHWTFASDTEILMSYRSTLLAAVAAVAVSGAAHAESFNAIQARKVDLGALTGVAYYTVEEDGHRLVVSLKAEGADTAVRFVTTLAPGQRVTVSVPRSAGEPPVDVHFVRHGEKIEVTAVGVAPHLEAQGD